MVVLVWAVLPTVFCAATARLRVRILWVWVCRTGLLKPVCFLGLYCIFGYQACLICIIFGLPC